MLAGADPTTKVDNATELIREVHVTRDLEVQNGSTLGAQNS